MNYWTESTSNIYVAAHRGWSSRYPENTILAFQGAMDLGVDQIETDIRITKDGELVCIHDAMVNRTTDGSGAVNSFSLAQLKSLDAGTFFGEEYAGCQIPTFLEAMELFNSNPSLTVDIELKEYPTTGNEETAYSVCDRVLKIVDEYGFTDRVVINSWSGTLLEYVYKKYGKKYRIHSYYPVCHLGKTVMDPAEYSFCCCMFKDLYSIYNIASRYAFDQMRLKGVEPWCGTAVCDEKSLDLAVANGTTLITCNDPKLILDLLRKKGLHM